MFRSCCSRQGHETEVQCETDETCRVGLLHQSNEDTIVEDAIALFALAVFDVGPVFIIIVDLGKSVGVSLPVEHFGELVLFSLHLRLGGGNFRLEEALVDFMFEEEIDGTCGGRHA